MTTLRTAAIAFGKSTAAKQFDGRKGHGGSSRVVERHFDEVTLAALLGAAFEHGAEYAAGHLATERRKLVTAMRAVIQALDGERTRFGKLDVDVLAGEALRLLAVELRAPGARDNIEQAVNVLRLVLRQQGEAA